MRICYSMNKNLNHNRYVLDSDVNSIDCRERHGIVHLNSLRTNHIWNILMKQCKIKQMQRNTKAFW